jgi:hypothetical protein
MTTSTDLAKAYVKHQGANGRPGDLVLDGLENSIAAWLDTSEKATAAEYVAKGDPKLAELVEAIRKADPAEVVWVTKYLINPDDESLWRDPRAVPMQFYGPNRHRFGLRSTSDDGIYSVGRS